jgi:hypothetical protein
MTSHPLTPAAWTTDGQFAASWATWQQMLQHSYGEHPYIARTGQQFYAEIYYKA